MKTNEQKNFRKFKAYEDESGVVYGQLIESIYFFTNENGENAGFCPKNEVGKYLLDIGTKRKDNVSMRFE